MEDQAVAQAVEQPAADESVQHDENLGSGKKEPEHAGDQPKGTAPQPATNPAKKRKVALFLAYVGHGYQGMQRNPGARTIEEELFKALHAAGAISDANNDDHGFMKIHWMRAARTDKGVSAVGQVVSLKMVLEPPGVVERVNAALPDQIRVFGYERATNGFDSRKHCDKRRYEYILPEWAFDPRQGLGRMHRAAAAESDAAPGQQQQQQHEQRGQQDEQQSELQQEAQPAVDPDAADGRADGRSGPAEAAQEAAVGQPADAEAAAQAGDAAAAVQPACDVAAVAQPPSDAEQHSRGSAGALPRPEGNAPFVFDETCVEQMNRILSHYEGTHNFHNFTVRKPATAGDVKRYIISFRCPGVLEIGGQRWVQLVVVGQSFMLHQIRKMVGMAVAVARGNAPLSCLQLAIKSSADLNTPLAPELGLFLDECFFDSYNEQWGALHAPLSLARFQAAADEFKASRLYPHIAQRDGEEGVNATWLRTLNDAHFRFSQWGQHVASIRQGGGRRPPPLKGAGAASLVGSMESYGQKRPLSGGRGGARGGAQDGKRRCSSFGGRTGRVLPDPGGRGGGGSGSGIAAANGPAAEYSD